jgi:hypothetical protein
MTRNGFALRRHPPIIGGEPQSSVSDTIPPPSDSVRSAFDRTKRCCRVGRFGHPAVLRSGQQVLHFRSGECGERRLNHGDGEAEKFYRDLQPSFWCLISRAIGNLKFTLTITAFIRR